MLEAHCLVLVIILNFIEIKLYRLHLIVNAFFLSFFQFNKPNDVPSLALCFYLRLNWKSAWKHLIKWNEWINNWLYSLSMGFLGHEVIELFFGNNSVQIEIGPFDHVLEGAVVRQLSEIFGYSS
jgi:hypothetical protein